MPIPNIPDNVQKLASYMKLEGLVLSNGNDWGSCDERDKTEINLINWCREFKNPLSGFVEVFKF